MTLPRSDRPNPWDVPRCYGRAEVYLPTGRESAAFDSWAMDEMAVPSRVLMENAGREAALVLGRVYDSGPVLVVAGSGNNGGDGLVLARTLHAAGREAKVWVVGERPFPDPLLHGWPVNVEPAPGDLEGAGCPGVVVDALLGTGIKGGPREPHASAIRAMNGLSAPIVSLDVPSGVDADTGATPGEVVDADLTIAFGAPKLGTLLFPGRERAGRIVALEIGFPPMSAPEIPARLITSGWAQMHRLRRELVTHKKAEGRVVIVAGSPGLGGAAVLAARGALRAGAGYVRVASHLENREVLQSSVPEALFVDVSDAKGLSSAAAECDALAAGPGMGLDEASAMRLNALLATHEIGGVVLDADALTLLGAGELTSVSSVATPERRLLTPHPGEMARLGVDPGAIRTDPLESCRRGADEFESALLLKGQPSLVAAPGGAHVWVSATGSSDLARAGVGDVLTGVAAAFLARGADAVDAGVLALHFTGLAAALTGRGETLLPTDIAENLSGALTDSQTQVSDLGFPFVTADLDPPH